MEFFNFFNFFNFINFKFNNDNNHVIVITRTTTGYLINNISH